MSSKGKIAVLIEEHFDATEYCKFNDYFPKCGYEVEYISHLWGNKELRFGSNPDNDIIAEHAVVTVEITQVKPSDYVGIICIGAYAMDRLRYQEVLTEPNNAPAVCFIREALKNPQIKIGTICHSLWLFCADRKLIEGRKVTCAHNIVCDVKNAGGEVIIKDGQTADIIIDGSLISAKHPAFVDLFVETFVQQIEAVNLIGTK